MNELFPNKREPLGLERKLRKAGYNVVAGVDEVGRGCLAGPVVACVVIIDCEKLSIAEEIRDSKKLPEDLREKYFDVLQNEAVGIGIGMVEHDVIDQVNILQATFLAMKQALSRLSVVPDILLVDGNQRIPILTQQICIPKGDDLVTSIGAASIIAKVTRDRLMKTIANRYPDYLFEKNKGYGTIEHIEAIRKNGYSEIHRRSFVIKEFIYDEMMD